LYASQLDTPSTAQYDADPDPMFHIDADSDPDSVGIKTMPILMRILPYFLHMFGNQNIYFFVF
jgi:hypothetical protein